METNVELWEKMERIYHDYFKDSKIAITKACLGNDTYFIKCYVANNEKECAWNILDNDMLNIMFRVQILENGNFELTNCAKSYFTRPNNEYYAYGRKDLSFRKVVGNEEKITKSFEKFVDNLKNSLIEDLENGNIHENHEQLLREKLA